MNFFDHYSSAGCANRIRFLTRNILFVRNVGNVDLNAIAAQSTNFRDQIIYCVEGDLQAAFEGVDATCLFARANGRQAMANIRVASFAVVRELQLFAPLNLCSIIIDIASVFQDSPGKTAIETREIVRRMLEDLVLDRTIIIVDSQEFKGFWSSIGVSSIQHYEELESGGMDQIIAANAKSRYFSKFRWKKAFKHAWTVF